MVRQLGGRKFVFPFDMYDDLMGRNGSTRVQKARGAHGLGG